MGQGSDRGDIRNDRYDRRSEHRYQRHSNHSESRKDSSRSESVSHNMKYKSRHSQRDYNHINNDKYESQSESSRTNSINTNDKLKNDNFDIISGLSSQMIWDERPDVEQLILLIISIIKWLDSDSNVQFNDDIALFEKIAKNKARISSIIQSIPNDYVVSTAPTDSILSNNSELPQELMEAKRIRSQVSVYDSFAKSISKLDSVNDIQNRIVEQEKTTREMKEKCNELRNGFINLHESIHNIRTSLSNINM